MRELAYTDARGDSVSTRLTDVAKNAGLTESDVSLDPAEGTRVIENEAAKPWR
jgi:outer membrane lipoprotein-sorting protein